MFWRTQYDHTLTFPYLRMSRSGLTIPQREGIQNIIHDHDDYNNYGDGQEGPKVTIHSSHGAFDTKEDGSASAYIINGPETNVAAGSGLRGIRWLRGP